MKHCLYGLLLFLSLSGCTNSDNRNNALIEDKKESQLIDNEEVINSDTLTEDSITKDSNLNETQKQVIHPRNLIPNGFIVFDTAQGDLNKDGLIDSVFVVKDTKLEAIKMDKYRGELDLNRRGLMIYFNKNEYWELASKTMRCFYSEDEDGGIYYVPDIEVNVAKGNLYINFYHGRYGWWKYTFRWEEEDFNLIGYDSYHNFGPIPSSETSINFLTKKKLFRENINAHDEDAEHAPVEFKDTWSDIQFNEFIKLSEINEFEELDMSVY